MKIQEVEEPKVGVEEVDTLLLLGEVEVVEVEVAEEVVRAFPQ